MARLLYSSKVTYFQSLKDRNWLQWPEAQQFCIALLSSHWICVAAICPIPVAEINRRRIRSIEGS